MNALRRIIFNVSIQKTKKLYSTIASVAIKNEAQVSSATENYTLEQHKHILETINKNDALYLERYQISKQRISMLKLHCDKNGPLESIQDLLKLPTMNEKLLKRFCDSILTNGKPTFKNLIYPSLNEKNCAQIDTVLSVYLGINTISWTQMNRELEVLQWNYKSFANINGKKNVLDQMKKTMDIIACLPESDVYVIEDSKINVPKNINNTGMYYLLLKTRVYSMIVFHLACKKQLRKKDTTTPFNNDLYILNTKAMGNYFDLIIGTEMKSCSKKVEELFNQETTENPSSKIVVEDQLKSYYKTCSVIEQEQMSFSLLACLIFLEVGVLKKNRVQLS